MFSIDFTEGAVAISHTLTYAEAEYTVECIKAVQKIFPDRKIGLIAHSMGGIVASLALTMAPELTESIFFMMSLSTPYEGHPLNCHLAFPVIYETIHDFWMSPESQKMFTLSVTGGVRDLLVPPQYSNIEELKNKAAMHIYSTEIEGLHLEMDHLALLWGKQFFVQIAQVLKTLLPMRDPMAMREATELAISCKLGQALNLSATPQGKIKRAQPPKTEQLKTGLGIEINPGDVMESSNDADLLLLYQNDTYVVQNGIDLTEKGYQYDDGYILRTIGKVSVFSDDENMLSV